jgi:hypothetical protein
LFVIAAKRGAPRAQFLKRQQMTNIEGQLPDTHNEYRGALCERTNNKTGKREWCVRFTLPSTRVDHQQVLWLAIPDGATWFTDRQEFLWFCSALELRRNVAVRFSRLDDAYGFLKHLRPCEIADAN